MSQTYSRVLLHVVFSTKDRKPCLGAEVRPALFRKFQGIIIRCSGEPLAVNGVADHVHLLFRLKPSVRISDAVRDIKASSSAWLKKQSAELQSFSWQRGGGVFSVSESLRNRLARYIENQEQHHQNQRFVDELRTLLTKHQIKRRQDKLGTP